MQGAFYLHAPLFRCRGDTKTVEKSIPSGGNDILFKTKSSEGLYILDFLMTGNTPGANILSVFDIGNTETAKVIAS